jgi:hypothetical protein
MQVMGRKMRKEYFVVYVKPGERKRWAARESNPEPND